MSPGPATAVLASLAAVALLADSWEVVAAVVALLLVVALRARGRSSWPYLLGALVTGASVFVLTPFVSQQGFHVLWEGPTLPVLGPLDVTAEELANGLFHGLRLAAVGLASAAYVLLVDHDRLIQAAGFARRSVIAVGLATRLVPTLERDAAGFVEALRGRGVEVGGLRGRARLLGPLVGGSLERGLLLAEAMEARGFGRHGRTRAPLPPWTRLDRIAVAGAATLVLVGAAWL